MTQAVIALLGRRDEPTDAVEEYCRYLGDALQLHKVRLEIERVPWEKEGWPKALRALKLEAGDWQDTWVLVQYTALAWSARGFPQRVLHVVRILKSCGARVGIVFHDVQPYSGSRLVDRLRRLIQLRTMQRAIALADLVVTTVSPEKISWLPPALPKIHFVPVGANLPISPSTVAAHPDRDASTGMLAQGPPAVGVFSITGGDPGTRETQHILAAVRHACQQMDRLRLSVFGRHAERRAAELEDGLRGLPVDLSVDGVAEAEEIVRKLSACDALLFVRGGISSRRSSAIAGIACGLPIVAFAGSETAAPITEAGVVLVAQDDLEALGSALTRVLADESYRAVLATKSRAAYQEHFSWSAIAARFSALLKS